jgi:hypothetical protein
VVKGVAGDGVAHIGEIIATGRDLGVVKINGDLGKIVAGNDSLPAPAIKSLTVGSYGMLDGTTQPAGASQSSAITGDLLKLTILGDMSGGAINVNGAINTVKIGGSIIGGPFTSDGRVFADSIAKMTVRGSIIGGAGGPSGGVSVLSNVGVFKVSGSIIGGSADMDQIAAQVRIGGAVGKFFVGGDIRGADGAGKQETIEVEGTVGSFTVGGNVTASTGKEASIYLADLVDVPGTAVGSITVGGVVENSVIGVGADLNRPVPLDRLTIGGSFIKSRIVVGTSFGPDLIAGDGDDVINAASRLNTLVIKGTVFGTVGGTDSYFIEAGCIGSAKLAGRTFTLAPGQDMIPAALSGDVFLRDAV